MDPTSDKKRLVIVTGARGVVGRAYLSLIAGQPHTVCVALARGDIGTVPDGTTCLMLDLLDAKSVATFVDTLSLGDIGEVILIHSVGKFKFEPDGLPERDLDGDGIDDEIYQTNIETFLNIFRSLLPHIEKEHQAGREVRLALCALGSISDKYQVAYWSSYTKAKNLLRSIIYNLIQEKPEYIRGLFINVSTIDTENENELRPYAEKTYWLKADEIAKASLPFILGESVGSWKQLDIYKESPLFREGYYENLEEIKRRWLAQMENRETAKEPIDPAAEMLGEVKVRVNDEIHDLFGDIPPKLRR